MLLSLGSSGIAFLTALVLGLFLGKASSHSPAMAGLGNYLTEARVALLPIFLAAVVIGLVAWPQYIVIGLVTGLFQALAMNRWIIKRAEDWNPALLSSITLGSSATTLFGQRARSRGAVVATMATTVLQVVLLEALLEALGLSTSENLGQTIVRGTLWQATLGLCLVAFSLLTLEFISSLLLQRRKPR